MNVLVRVVSAATQSDCYATARIEVQEIQRDRKRPEWTIYRITAEGRALFQRWMREMLSVPAREFPQLPAALAFLGLFSCDDVLQQLRTRASALEQELAATAPADSALPRIFLVEDEYLHAMTQAELRWVNLIIGELERGELHWDTDALRSFVPPPGPSQ